MLIQLSNWNGLGSTKGKTVCGIHERSGAVATSLDHLGCWNAFLVQLFSLSVYFQVKLDWNLNFQVKLSTHCFVNSTQTLWKSEFDSRRTQISLLARHHWLPADCVGHSQWLSTSVAAEQALRCYSDSSLPRDLGVDDLMASTFYLLATSCQRKQVEIKSLKHNHEIARTCNL